MLNGLQNKENNSDDNGKKIYLRWQRGEDYIKLLFLTQVYPKNNGYYEFLRKN